MYRVWYSKKFSKAFAKLAKGGLKKSTQEKVKKVIETLAAGKELDAGYRDHQLQGEFEMYRECHIQGDLLLVYQIKDKEAVLILINIGSHSQIFG
jgi:mRNA interferase YafQ